MSETTNEGFPKGRVARTLRKILYPELTEHQVEAIVVCLMAHLLIEKKLNHVLYRWLRQDAPECKEDKSVSKSEDDLWKNIVKMDFAKKYTLVEPFFAMHFSEEAANIWKINDLRNAIFHGRAIADAKFENQPLSDEKTVEKIFLAAQVISMSLDTFEEMIDAPHANAERWRKRLSEFELQKDDKSS